MQLCIRTAGFLNTASELPRRLFDGCHNPPLRFRASSCSTFPRFNVLRMRSRFRLSSLNSSVFLEEALTISAYSELFLIFVSSL